MIIRYITPLKYSKGLFYLLLFFSRVISAQESPKFSTYTIETTYQKLKKEYPFITPIVPLVSDKIKYKENITYKKTNTSNLKLDVYYPNEKSKKTYPAVLLIHGGGWLVGSKENERVMAQHLALNGYVGISVSYRLGFEATYPAGVNDLKDAIVWARTC